jgi:hypothetical protein
MDEKALSIPNSRAERLLEQEKLKLEHPDCVTTCWKCDGKKVTASGRKCSECGGTGTRVSDLGIISKAILGSSRGEAREAKAQAARPEFRGIIRGWAFADKRLLKSRIDRSREWLEANPPVRREEQELLDHMEGALQGLTL